MGESSSMGLEPSDRGSGKARRSASTRLSLDHGPRPSLVTGDLAAVATGQTVQMICYFRRLYSNHDRRFRAYFLELTADGPVLVRKLLFMTRKRIPVIEEIRSARVREFEDQREAWRFASTGLRAPGGLREWEGSSIIACETAQGVIEFGVGRRNVPLVLHYFELMRKRRQPSL